MDTITSLFIESVEKFSSMPALRMRPKWRTLSWTFRQLGNFAANLAAVLETHGVAKADKVIIISPNMPQWVGSFFAIFLRAGVVIPLNPQSSASFVRTIIDQTGAKVLLKPHFLSFDDITIPMVDIDVSPDFALSERPLCPLPVTPDDIAQIVYTSGTTGDPKGVVLSHHNIMANLKAISEVFTPTHGDKTVSVLPLFHMFEQTAGLLAPLAHGIEIMYAHALSSRAIQGCMQEMGVSKMIMVPEMLEAIIGRVERLAQQAGKEKMLRRLFGLARYCPYWVRRLLFYRFHKRFGGRLRLIVSGGAALPVEIEEKWNLLGVRVLQGYGLSETSPVVSTNSESCHKLGSVGKVVSSAQVAIASDGEILVSGESVFEGYYNDPKRTQESFDHLGRYKTGDLGYIDDDGFLYINGRKKYVIIGSNGENVYPNDIEAALKSIPSVTDAAVIGIPVNGREIIYAVLLGEIADPSSIVAQANQQLAPYQRIQDYSVWPEADFPRSATRKIRKEVLKKWLVSQEKEVQSVSRIPEVTPLIRLLAQVSHKPASSINEQTNIVKDLHLDSLMRIELVSAIEEQMDVTIDEHDITDEITVALLEKKIDASVRSEHTSVFRAWSLFLPVRIIRIFLQYIIIYPIYGLWVKVKVEGVDNLLHDRPVIFMPNHVSYVDAWFVYKALPVSLRSRIAIAAAVDFMYVHYWWIAWLVEFVMNTYRFPRTQGENIKPGLQATGAFLDKGFSILIFPEGKISKTGSREDLKLGAGLLATEMDAPIIPVCIDGVSHVLGDEKLLPHRRGVVTVRFGKPLVFSAADSYVAATKSIAQEIDRLK